MVPVPRWQCSPPASSSFGNLITFFQLLSHACTIWLNVLAASCLCLTGRAVNSSRLALSYWICVLPTPCLYPLSPQESCHRRVHLFPSHSRSRLFLHVFIIRHWVESSNYKSDYGSTHTVCFRIRFNYILSYIQFYIKDTPHRLWSIHMERWLLCPISIQYTIKFSFLSFIFSFFFLPPLFGGEGDMVSLWLSG